MQKKIAKLIESRLDLEALLLHDDGFHLRTLMESCFLVEGKGSKADKAAIIFAELFAKLLQGFRFDKFLEKIEGQKDKTRFLTELLYHIWSSTFPIKHLASQDEFTRYLYQQAAGIVSDKALKTLWDGLSSKEQLALLEFSFTFQAEGTFRLLQLARSSFTRECECFERGVSNDVAHHTKELQKLFGDVSLAFTKKFVGIFGIYGHQVPEKAAYLNDYATLDEKIQAGKDVKEFIDPIRAHVHALQHHPEQYKEGLERIALAVPTYNRSLANLPFLHSMLSGLKLFCETIEETKIKDYPIFVIDQSPEPLYRKNHRYIVRLAKEFGGSLIHLSKRECIALAKRLGLDKLIITAPNERFGYAGCRNAVFFLTPILHKLFQLYGTSCFEKAMSLPQKMLKSLFHEVMFDPKVTPAVYMGDDDWWVPPATVFSEALYAYRHKNKFFWRSGFHVGRWTTRVIACLDPNTILHGLGAILSQFLWSDEGIIHGMSGALSKPKICINIPYGQEEPHFQPMQNDWQDFRRPSYHLAGVRYPNKPIPTNHFVGLASYLKSLNSYVFDLFQVTELLQPPNPPKSPLIWNRRKKPFKNLSDAMKELQSDETKRAMQKQFWENLAEYVSDFNRKEPRPSGLLYTSVLLQMLIDLDRDKIFREYYKINPLAKHFRSDLNKLKQYLADLAEEALCYKEFATLLLQEKKKNAPQKAIESAKRQVEKAYKKPITSMLFAHTLYLIARSVGAGGFQEALHFTALRRR